MFKNQAWFQGRSKNKKTKNSIRLKYNQFDPPYDRISKLCFFFNYNQDLQTLKSLCDELLSSPTGFPVMLNVFLDVNVESFTRYIYLLNRLNRLLLQNICLVNDEAYNYSLFKLNYRTATLFIDLIATTLTISCKFKKDKQSSICQKISKQLLTSNLYLTIINYFTLYPSTSNILAQKLINLAVLPLTLDNVDDIFDSFIQNFISTTFLQSIIIDREAYQVLFSKTIFPFDYLVKRIDVYNKTNSKSTLFLLANILQIFQGRLFSTIDLRLVSIVIKDLIFGISQSFVDQLHKETRTDEIEEEDDVVMSDVKSKPLDNLLANSILTLFAQPFLTELTKLLSANSLTDTSLFCEFIFTLMTKFDFQKTQIFRILMYKSDTSILKSLWSFIKNGDLIKYLLAETLYVSIFTVQREEWFILAVFVELLQRFLVVLGDDEFFAGGLLGNVKEFHLVSTVLRNVVFFMWTTKQSTDLVSVFGIDFFFIKKRFTTLFQQLHTRDCRRQYCPQTHWIMTSKLDLDTFATLSAFEEDEPSSLISSDQSLKTYSTRELLNQIPFVLPFHLRVGIFRRWIDEDRQRLLGGGEWRSGVKIDVRRDHVFDDGFLQMNSLGSGLKKRVQITFVNDHGMVEAGIDGGGVFKEFLTSLSKIAFNTNFGLFRATPDQCIYPSPTSRASQENDTKYFQFLGRILGKAVYEGILVDLNFANFFLAKTLGRQNYLDDLPSLDQELYQGDVRELGLTFSIDSQLFGQAVTYDLMPHGRQKPVTNENRIMYIYLMANFKLNTQIEAQSSAFFSGLSDLISPHWLKMFTPQEIQILFSGVPGKLDILDLKQNTVYNGVYDADHESIKLFWEVVENDLTDQELTLFLRFVTSCDRPPLMGFKELSDEDRLPTASTCVNLLKLPMYRSRRGLREKLVYSIKAEAGFDLS